MDPTNRHTPKLLGGAAAEPRKRRLPSRPAIDQQGRVRFKHDEVLIARFLALKEEAWRREGLPFHIWLTSLALEILDVTFAMNLGWAKTREQCARLIVYQSIHEPALDPVYHSTLVGPDFFLKAGVAL